MEAFSFKASTPYLIMKDLPSTAAMQMECRRQVQWPEGNVRLESLYLKPERMAWRIINGKFHHDGVLMLFPIFRYQRATRMT